MYYIMADLGNQDINEYINMSAEQLEVLERELSLWINQEEVADRRNLVEQLIIYRRSNPEQNLTPEILEQRVPLARGPLYGLQRLQMTYQQVVGNIRQANLPAGGKRSKRKSKKSRKTRKSRKTMKRMRR